MEKLRQAKQAGHLTLILSSSPEFLVAPIAKKLDVPLWQATKYEVDKDLDFCHISQLILGHHKANIIEELRKNHSAKEIIAYSDSHLDLPFLLAADLAIGVNPNRQLRAICQRNNWPII